MRWLVDTNVLLRGAQASHPMYGVVSNAVEILKTRHDDVYVIGQNLVEFGRWRRGQSPTMDWAFPSVKQSRS